MSQYLTGEVAEGVGTVESASFHIESPSDKEYVFEQDAQFYYTVDHCTHVLAAGTYYWSLFIAGRRISGFYEVPSSTTEKTQYPSIGGAGGPTQVRTGDKVRIVGSGVSGDASDFSGTFRLTRTSENV